MQPFRRSFHRRKTAALIALFIPVAALSTGAIRAHAQEPEKEQQKPPEQGQQAGQEQASSALPPSRPALNNALLPAVLSNIIGANPQGSLAQLLNQPNGVGKALGPEVTVTYYPNITAMQAQNLMAQKGGVFIRLFSNWYGKALYYPGLQMPAVGGNMMMWSVGSISYTGTITASRRKGSSSAAMATPPGQPFALPYREWQGGLAVYNINDVVMARTFNASAGGLGPIPGWHVIVTPTKEEKAKEEPKEGKAPADEPGKSQANPSSGGESVATSPVQEKG
jgi:hypothetical protein